MGWLIPALGFLSTLGSLLLEWLKRMPNDDRTSYEKSLDRRKKYAENKLRFAKAIARGDSESIQKQLSDIIDELELVRMRQAAENTDTNAK